MKAAQEKVAELEGIVTGLGAVCDERMDHLNAVHKRAEAAEAGLKVAQEKSTEWAGIAETKAAEAELLRRSLADAEGRYSACYSELGKVQRERDAAQERIAELEAEKTPLYSDRIANLERERDALQAGVVAVLNMKQPVFRGIIKVMKAAIEARSKA